MIKELKFISKAVQIYSSKFIAITIGVIDHPNLRSTKNIETQL